jgi:hypothetical protein
MLVMMDMALMATITLVAVPQLRDSTWQQQQQEQ